MTSSTTSPQMRSKHGRELLRLAADLEVNLDPDEETFTSLVERTLRLVPISDLDFSEMIPIASRPTVTRWKHGKTWPVPPVRSFVVKIMRREVQRALREMAR